MTAARQLTIDALRDETAELVERRRPIYSADFRAWYAAYPRKRSPGDAWRAWQALKERPPLAELLEALDWQKKTDQWTRDGGRWIPYPATYLRGRAFEDDPPARGDYCPFHASRRNDGHRNPNGPRRSCPECRHLEAAAGTRSGDPVTAAEAMPAPRVLPDRRDSPELRADFGRLFPGQPWPGFAAAFRAVSGKMGRP